MKRNGAGVPLHRGHWYSLISGVLMVLLVGCASGNAPVTSPSGGGSGLASSNGDQQPTPPPFPAFTVGAWVANTSPEKGEQDRIYVLTRIHPPDMSSSQPPPAGSVNVTVSVDSVAQSSTTDKAGYAFFNFTANAPPAAPSVIQVVANYQGTPYRTTTFYTVLPDIGTPTPGPGTPTTTPQP